MNICRKRKETPAPHSRAGLPPTSAPTFSPPSHFLCWLASPTPNWFRCRLVTGQGPGRRSRRAGAAGAAAGGAPGPPSRAGDEPARGGVRAAASPRLAARERVGRGGGEPAGLLGDARPPARGAAARGAGERPPGFCLEALGFLPPPRSPAEPRPRRPLGGAGRRRKAATLPWRAPREPRAPRAPRAPPAPRPPEGAPAPRAPWTHASVSRPRRPASLVQTRLWGPDPLSHSPAAPKDAQGFFVLGSFGVQSCSQGPPTHSAFSQVVRVFLDTNSQEPTHRGCPPGFPKFTRCPPALHGASRPLGVPQTRRPPTRAPAASAATRPALRPRGQLAGLPGWTRFVWHVGLCPQTSGPVFVCFFLVSPPCWTLRTRSP